MRRALAGDWPAEPSRMGQFLDPVPGVADLAARHGDSRGKAVHFTAASVRYLWLDRAQRARRS